jgi:hypothetical protein
MDARAVAGFKRFGNEYEMSHLDERNALQKQTLFTIGTNYCNGRFARLPFLFCGATCDRRLRAAAGVKCTLCNNYNREEVTSRSTSGLFWHGSVAYSSYWRLCLTLVPAEAEGTLCKPRFSVRNAIYQRASVCATATAAIATDNRAFGFAWTANTIARGLPRSLRSSCGGEP